MTEKQKMLMGILYNAEDQALIEERNHAKSREFDSYILKKQVAGHIKPAFFMSTFLFYSMLFSVII